MDYETGSALAAMVDETVARIRKDPSKRRIAVKPEATTASVIERLTVAAMPSVRAASRDLQRVRAENEIQRRKH